MDLFIPPSLCSRYRQRIVAEAQLSCLTITALFFLSLETRRKDSSALCTIISIQSSLFLGLSLRTQQLTQCKRVGGCSRLRPHFPAPLPSFPSPIQISLSSAQNLPPFDAHARSPRSPIELLLASEVLARLLRLVPHLLYNRGNPPLLIHSPPSGRCCCACTCHPPFFPPYDTERRADGKHLPTSRFPHSSYQALAA